MTNANGYNTVGTSGPMGDEAPLKQTTPREEAVTKAIATIKGAAADLGDLSLTGDDIAKLVSALKDLGGHYPRLEQHMQVRTERSSWAAAV